LTSQHEAISLTAMGPRQYPTFTCSMILRRQPLQYLSNMALPCFMTTLLAPLAFFIQPEALGDRFAMATTLLLTLFAIRFMVTQELPSIPYPTWMDWYMLYNIGFMTATTFLLASSSLTAEDPDSFHEHKMLSYACFAVHIPASLLWLLIGVGFLVSDGWHRDCSCGNEGAMEWAKFHGVDCHAHPNEQPLCPELAANTSRTAGRSSLWTRIFGRGKVGDSSSEPRQRQTSHSDWLPHLLVQAKVCDPFHKQDWLGFSKPGANAVKEPRCPPTTAGPLSTEPTLASDVRATDKAQSDSPVSNRQRINLRPLKHSPDVPESG